MIRGFNGRNFRIIFTGCALMLLFTNPSVFSDESVDTVTVQEKEQTITSSPIPEAVTNGEHSSSGLPASDDTSVIKVEDGAGSARISASQPGDSVFEAASTVTRETTVKDVPVIPEQQPKGDKEVRQSLKKTMAVIIAAGGAILTGTVIGIIASGTKDRGSGKGSTGLENDFPLVILCWA